MLLERAGRGGVKLVARVHLAVLAGELQADGHGFLALGRIGHDAVDELAVGTGVGLAVLLKLPVEGHGLVVDRVVVRVDAHVLREVGCLTFRGDAGVLERLVDVVGQNEVEPGLGQRVARVEGAVVEVADDALVAFGAAHIDGDVGRIDVDLAEAVRGLEGGEALHRLGRGVAHVVLDHVDAVVAVGVRLPASAGGVVVPRVDGVGAVIRGVVDALAVERPAGADLGERDGGRGVVEDVVAGGRGVIVADHGVGR